jgi:hypothetical protein
MRNLRVQYEDSERISQEITARGGSSEPGVPVLSINTIQLGGLDASAYQQVTARSAKLGELGIWVGASPPASPITYAAWISGTTGYWGWISTP